MIRIISTAQARLSSHSPSVLPIWKNPERSKIVREEWPFRLSGFEIKGSLESKFPAIVLNLPFGSTESFQDKYLRVLIRNPQNLRHWPEGRMTEFS